MADESKTAEEVIAQLAGSAHGNLTHQELLAAGVTRHQIAGRVENGSLIPKHHGVYRAGHAAPSVEADYMAAVKAGGPKALLSGHAAIFLWYLIKGSPPRPKSHVQPSGGSRR